MTSRSGPPVRGDLAWDDHLVDELVEPVSSATVVLVRDDPDGVGLQTLLLGRHRSSDFAAGALVFPGGKVDETDREVPPAHLRIGNPLRWRQLLGASDERDAVGLLVAALRETFEEAGVLLASRADGTPVTAADLASPSFVAARRRLAERGRPWDWRPWLEDEALVLDLGAVAMWSWWVTPKGRRKRFDTRFLVAEPPPGQEATHDRVETTSLTWTRPQEALAAHRRGEVSMMFPTRCNLQALATYRCAAEVLRAAWRGQVDRRRTEPALRRVDGHLVVQHPFRGPHESL